MQNNPDLAVTFLKNPVEKIILKAWLDVKSQYKDIPQVNLTQKKHPSKRYIKKKDVSFSCPLGQVYLLL